MNSQGFPESDWKVFRRLRELALERFCARVLEDLAERCRGDDSRDAYELYLEVYELLQQRDRELGLAFDDPRRSRMMAQLAMIYSHGLLEPAEFEQFTARTRERVTRLTELE